MRRKECVISDIYIYGCIPMVVKETWEECGWEFGWNGRVRNTYK